MPALAILIGVLLAGTLVAHLRLRSAAMRVARIGRVDATGSLPARLRAVEAALADGARLADGSSGLSAWLAEPRPAGAERVAAVARIEHYAQLRRSLTADEARELAALLERRVREAGDGVRTGRIGGGTLEIGFVAASAAQAERLLGDLRDRLARPVTLGGRDLTIGIEVGYDVAQPGDPGAAIDRAHAALGQPGREPIRGYRASPDAGEDAALLADLRRAIADDDGLYLAYQPKMRARDETIGSAEALLRWRHAARGSVPPDKVVAVVEAAGETRMLTEWVLHRAMADMARFRAAGLELSVAINLSGCLLGDAGFGAWLLATLGAERRIGLEITETAVIDNPEQALANLRAFADAGLHIAIDDYGSGLSSLAYLKQLPAQELKIDKLFIERLTSSHRDPLLVRSTIDLAHALEMEVTAEGVDHPASFALLRAMGCDLIQGYLIGRPMPVEALVAFLAEEAHRDAVAQPGVSLLRPGPPRAGQG